MRLEQLYYLVEVAKTGSISLTAERIYVSQPSITDAIKKLEQELGATLLLRSHRGVCLTDAGEKVLKTSTAILGMVDDLKSELELNNDKKPATITGSLSIYASPDITSVILPNVLEVFCQRYPNVNTFVKESDIFTTVEGIQDGDADLGIILMIESIMGNDICKIALENTHFEKLFFSQIYALVGESSPLASRRSISMIELMKYPLVIFSTHTSDCWIDRFEAFGNPNIYIRSSSLEVYVNAIINNQAIGFMPDYFIKYMQNKYNFVPIPIEGELTGVVGWLRPNKDEFMPAAQEFIKILKSQC